jgi:hypothetical protein
MCFSAAASFIAGTALLAVGTATVRKAGRKAELPFAAVPLLFGVQQLVEGALWVGLRSDAALLNVVLTQVYSLFSHVLWPVYVPFAVLLLEPVPWRRKTVTAFLLVGAAVGLYLLYAMVPFPIGAEVSGGHIRYVAPQFYGLLVMGAYLATTCLGTLVSSHRTVVAFGVVMLLSFIAAYGLYALWFISVWCFFAAVLSGVVYLYFRDGARDGASDGARRVARLP